MRDTDLFGRWGGEEFLIIAPRTGLEGAAALAERLRHLVAAHAFEVGTVTASFGVASYQPGDSVDSLGQSALTRRSTPVKRGGATASRRLCASLSSRYRCLNSARH